MDLSKTVACAALLIVVVLAAGHALAQPLTERERQRIEEFTRLCTIKAVMSDAEIERCRTAHRR